MFHFKIVFNALSTSGQAVSGTYTKEVNNTCMYQDAAKTMVYWTYNATNPLPNCIRKCYFSSFLWLPLNNIFFKILTFVHFSKSTSMPLLVTCVFFQYH